MTVTLLGLTVTVARRPRKSRPVLALTPDQVAQAGGLAAFDGYDLVVGYPLGTRTDRITSGWGWER